MWFVWLGPSGSEEALEPVSDPVWQQRGKPVGCAAFSLLHGVLHHRGTGLLQHRHRTHERQELPRRRRLYPKVRQPLRLTTTLFPNPARPIPPPFKTAACWKWPCHPGELAFSFLIQCRKHWVWKRIVYPGSHPTEGNCPSDTGPLTVTVRQARFNYSCAVFCLQFHTELLHLT